MPLTRTRLGQEPRSLVAEPDQWPDTRPLPDAPAAVAYGLVLGRKIAALLAAQGLTGAAFAREIGIARQTVHDILTGRTLPDLHTLVWIEQTYGVRIWPTPKELRELTGE